MKAYIDKSAVVAEIEKRLNTTKKYSTEYVNGKKYALKKILSFLDTLEVKEVDLEQISKNYALNNTPWDDCMVEIQDAFKSGFELGLKAHEGGQDLEVKEVNEEPVSNDLEEAARKAATWRSRLKGDIFFENDFQKFIAGAEWQKEQIIEKACVFLKSTDFYKYYNREFVKEFVKAMEK